MNHAISQAAATPLWRSITPSAMDRKLLIKRYFLAIFGERVGP
jgi:hypothetical protein